MMSSIIKMNLPMLSNIEMAGYGQECAAATELLSAVTELGSLTQYFNSKLEEYQAKLMLKGTEAYTNRIHNSVEAAKDAWTGLYRFVGGLTYSPDEKVAQAAVSVLGKMDFYGNIQSLSYDAKFGIVISLVADITADEVEALGIKTFVDTLKKGNDDFVQASAERKDYRKLRKAAVRTARAALEQAYRALVNNVESLVVANGIGAYEAFVNRINELVIERAEKKSSNTNTAATQASEDAQAEQVAEKDQVSSSQQPVEAENTTEGC